MNLAAALPVLARTRPTHPAIVDDTRTVTYRELRGHLAAFATRFATAGIGEGTIVGVALHDTAEHLVAHYALSWLGAVILPLDVRWTAAERESVAAHFGASHIVVDRADAEVTRSRRKIVIDPLRPGESEAGAPPIVERPNLPVLISLSSGTTGEPRGPTITHEQLYHRFVMHWVALTFNRTDRFLSATPLYFGGGRAFCMSYLHCGGTVVLFPPPYSPQALCEAVERFAITSLFLVPTLLRRLVDENATGTPCLPRLRVLISSGAALFAAEREAVRTLVNPNLYEYYSSTEGGGVSVLDPDEQHRYPDSVGRASYMVEVEIVDVAGNTVAPNTIGEVRYRSPGVAGEGWFYPGDLGEMNEDGYVFIRGRAKDMIIRGGINIYPAEIENALKRHAAVSDVAVLGTPSREFGEEVVAFVVARGVLAEETLRAYARTALAPYKVPSRFEIIDDFPRNSAGKVLKSELLHRLLPNA